MYDRLPKSLAAALCIAGCLGVAATPAQALTVHDPANLAEAVKLLEQARKQYEAAMQQLEEMKTLVERVAGTAQTITSTTSMTRAAAQATQCLVPDIANLQLPDGFAPRYTSLCSALDSSEQILFGDEAGATYNGETLTPYEAERALADRRDAAAKDAVVASYALAKTNQQTIQQTHDVAGDLIDEANAAQDLLTLMRIQTKAFALLLTEQANIRALLAASVETQAAYHARQQPKGQLATTTTLE